MLRLYLILALSAFTAQIAWAEGAAPNANPTTSAPAAASESGSQQFARAKLMEMAKFLAGTKKFSATLRVGYDVVQKNGQKIEFGEVRELSVERPNHVRIEEQASHGGRNLMLFDGKQVTMFDDKTSSYAQAPQPGSIDDTIVYFVRDLKMRLPLAPMLMAHLPEELQSRVQSIDYVEQTEMMGQSAHHIVARTSANVDFQVWIADGKRPLPLRIVLTYPKADGQPQFWAEFTKWNLSPRFGKAAFTFKPPAGAKKIVFAVQIQSQSGAAGPSNAQKQGDKP
jgi:hypothetical protein